MVILGIDPGYAIVGWGVIDYTAIITYYIMNGKKKGTKIVPKIKSFQVVNN